MLAEDSPSPLPDIADANRMAAVIYENPQGSHH